MEKIGAVNRYVCKSHAFHTINLNVGTTPFTTLCPECKEESVSSVYVIKNKITQVDYCWYRPIKDFIVNLNVETQRHVLNGGLVLGKMGRVVPLVDPVSLDWGVEEFSDFVKHYYGVESPGNHKPFDGLLC
jgi:hypothetical protein